MSATLTNQTQNTASVTNAALSQGTLGDKTFDEVGTKTFDQIGGQTFDSRYIVVTNQAKN